MPAESTITLTSTSDTEAQVRAAVGAPAVPEPAPVAVPPADPAPPVVAAPVVDPEDDDEPIVAPTEGVVAPSPEAAAAAAALGRQGGIKRGRLQARIDELTAESKRITEERQRIANEKLLSDTRIAALEAQLAARQAEAVKTPAVVAPPAATTPTELKVEDFENYELYTKAVARAEAMSIAQQMFDERMKARDEETRAASVQAQMTRAAQQYNERAQVTRTKFTDFDTVINRPDLLVSTTMKEVLFRSEKGPEMVYYLAQHPEECKALAGLGDSGEALLRLGRLEGSVDTLLTPTPAVVPPVVTPPVVTPPVVEPPVAVIPPAPRVSKAPDPIVPVNGGAPPTTVPLDQMAYRDYVRKRNEDERARLGLR